MKPIRFSKHATDNLRIRGCTEAEVITAIREGDWAPARGLRWETRMNFTHADEWRGKMYTDKQVRPVFVEEPAEIVVVTVYCYFFNRD